MDIKFCDLCNESVPQAVVERSLAAKPSGRIICLRCEAAMTSESGEVQAGVVGKASKAPGKVDGPGGPMAPAPSAGTGPAAGVAAGAGSPGLVAGAQPGVRQGGRSGIGWVALVFAAGATAFLVDWGRKTEASMGGRFDSVQASAVAADRRSERRADSLAAQLTQSEARILDLVGEQLAPVQAELTELRGAIERQALRHDDLKQELELARADGDARHRTNKLTFDRQAALLERIDNDQRFYSDRIIKLEEDLRGISKGGIPRNLLPGGAESTPTDGTPSWTGILPDLVHASSAIRLEAVYALGETKDALVIPHLLPRLNDEDLFVRLATARILEALNATQAIPNLIDALEDQETAVREAAVIALRTITGQNFRFDPSAAASERSTRIRDWRDWLKKRPK